MNRRNTGGASALVLQPLGPAEMLQVRAGGDHEDPWLWLVMGPRDPSQPPPFPPPEPPG